MSYINTVCTCNETYNCALQWKIHRYMFDTYRLMYRTTRGPAVYFTLNVTEWGRNSTQKCWIICSTIRRDPARQVVFFLGFARRRRRRKKKKKTPPSTYMQQQNTIELSSLPHCFPVFTIITAQFTVRTRIPYRGLHFPASIVRSSTARPNGAAFHASGADCMLARSIFDDPAWLAGFVASTSPQSTPKS